MAQLVASDTRVLQFESSYRQKFFWTLFWKDKKKEKRPGMAHLKNCYINYCVWHRGHSASKRCCIQFMHKLLLHFNYHWTTLLWVRIPVSHIKRDLLLNLLYEADPRALSFKRHWSGLEPCLFSEALLNSRCWRILQTCVKMGGSPGLVVMGDDSWSRGCGFESLCRIMDAEFFTFD